MTRWKRLVYPTKPGPSPLLGGLWLAGALLPGHRALDVGCGTGTDALALAEWGLRDVVGIDVSPRAIGIARRRAAKARSRARFEVCDVVDVPQRFPRGAFDVVVDSMCCNNLAEGQEEAYVEAMDWVLSREGFLVLQGRMTRKDFEARQGLWLEGLLSERFEVAGPLHVALPDSTERAARVAAYLVERPRRRRGYRW